MTTFQQYSFITVALKNTKQKNSSCKIDLPMQACTIAGTQKLNSFIPSSESTLLTKQVSGHRTLESINGFITCVYEDHWWLACAMQSDVDTETVHTIALFIPVAHQNHSRICQKKTSLIFHSKRSN